LKIITPRNAVILIAIISGIVFSLLAFIIHFLPDNYYWWSIAAGIILLFASIYILGLYIIEKFIYRKIKLIYKTIHKMKMSGTGLPAFIDMDSDILSQVNKDVVDWAKSHQKEIEQLKSQEEYRKEFIGNVAHELKTPIFNIQGYILTLLEGGLEDEKINRDYLMRAEKSVERMIGIVDDLDTVTRLESGQLTMENIKFDLNELAREIIEAHELRAKKRDIKLRVKNLTDKPVYVYADKDRIRQVLSNLIVNSIKYGKQNGITEIRFYDLEENILVEVADDGIGISEEHLHRLFERFYRVDKSRSREFGGSGLGLAIVKHIIEAHEQTINVRSTKGLGSTFSFTLQKS
jgi:two-component system, OmpR family, phosphate regulon sensor histidine kinase PhoR